MKTNTEPHPVPRCEIRGCNEPLKLDKNGDYAEEVGEFWDEKNQTSLLGHAQCGDDAGLEIA